MEAEDWSSAGQRTGVTAGRAEERGHCWQGRGQGSLLQCRGLGHIFISHPCIAHSLSTGHRASPPHTSAG
ncbi:unnamed protein product [Staurois parvus]|uniref:Uncharacterized protein n=1 Tax=Staurois parvus TaxID=386267 RepID=A0ABN9H209_9NEOB|nr:unnamed protein product [Staurois parvus]